MILLLYELPLVTIYSASPDATLEERQCDCDIAAHLLFDPLAEHRSDAPSIFIHQTAHCWLTLLIVSIECHLFPNLVYLFHQLFPKLFEKLFRF